MEKIQKRIKINPIFNLNLGIPDFELKVLDFWFDVTEDCPKYRITVFGLTILNIDAGLEIKWNKK